jgi:hypothetical protein
MTPLAMIWLDPLWADTSATFTLKTSRLAAADWNTGSLVFLLQAKNQTAAIRRIKNVFHIE